MTAADASYRPGDDEVLRTLHGELAGTGSSLWPTWAGGALHPA